MHFLDDFTLNGWRVRQRIVDSLELSESQFHKLRSLYGDDSYYVLFQIDIFDLYFYFHQYRGLEFFTNKYSPNHSYSFYFSKLKSFNLYFNAVKLLDLKSKVVYLNF